jgi:transposase
VIQEREEFQAAQPSLRTEDLVWIDEAAVNLSMTPAYGRAKKGVRVIEYRPNIRTKKTSLVGAIGLKGMYCLGKVDGSYNAVRFLAWLTEELLPKLPRGRVLIWDNIPFHSNAEVLAAVEKAGCTTLKMPPYSPDLNPIEECWSKLKQHIRAAKARSQAELVAAIETAQGLLDTPDFDGWIGHAGYVVPGST